LFLLIERNIWLLAYGKASRFFSSEYFNKTRQCQLNRRAVITLHYIKAGVFLIKKQNKQPKEKFGMTTPAELK